MSNVAHLGPWVQQQSSFAECLRPQDVEHFRQIKLNQLESSTVEVVGDETTFLAWDTSAIEAETQKPIALLWGRQGAEADLRDLLLESAGKFSDRPLVVSAYANETAWTEVLQALGFYTLRHFVTKTMAAQKVESVHRVRPGSERDRSFWGAVAMTNAVHTLPPGRKEEARIYSSATMRTIMRLDIGPESEHRLLIAEDQQGASLAYLLLRLDDRKTVWVVDIGVEKSHWGAGLAQLLVLTAENQYLELGYEFYVGEISAANTRSFRVATEICGFSPNRDLWQR